METVSVRRWLACALLLALPAFTREAGPPRASANDQRHEAGTMRGHTRVVRLVAERARWRPDGDDGPGVDVNAFAQEGRAPSMPGPLVRVDPGDTLDLTLRNTLADTLAVVGLGRHFPGFAGDTLRVAPGATARLVTRDFGPGITAYYGVTIKNGKPSFGTGSLLGIMQVGPLRAHERLLALNIFFAPADTVAHTQDRVFWTVNGRMWPHTERFTFDVGDTVRWRVVDLTADEHPMHLHGFYFRVDERTSWTADSTYAPDRRYLAVTEPTPRGGSFALTWVPERPGNWLFHCHKLPHMSGAEHHDLAGLPGPAPMPDRPEVHEHLRTGMGGLIVGITVRGRAPAPDTMATRHIRMLMEERARADSSVPERFGVVLLERGVRSNDSLGTPGPVLALTRGELTEITVVNHLHCATSVHWHGIELESYYDGVAGWSGSGSRTAPLIMPGDSFVVRMRPPRAGTFMYHTHVHETQQVPAGLLGALVVLDPGQRWDPTRDHVLFIHEVPSGDSVVVGVNGEATPGPLVLRADQPNRLRFIQLIADAAANVGLFADSLRLTWRPVAKDGADLQGPNAQEGPARLRMLPGQTWDVDVTPARGDYTLQVASADTVRVSVVVR
jgi:FtsP/CotA-like multicopper oxidase with cupredoxin domain